MSKAEKEPERLLGYANRVLAAMNRTSKPVELTDVEWKRKKTRLTGVALWLTGSAALQLDRYSQADKSIRAALPYLKSDSQMTAAALFYLGWANYQMHNYPDAVRFNQQCLALKSPFQDKAARNLEVIHNETGAP